MFGIGVWNDEVIWCELSLCGVWFLIVLVVDIVDFN